MKIIAFVFLKSKNIIKMHPKKDNKKDILSPVNKIVNKDKKIIEYPASLFFLILKK